MVKTETIPGVGNVLTKSGLMLLQFRKYEGKSIFCE